MGELLEFSWNLDSLGKALGAFEAEARAAVREVVSRTLDRAYSMVRARTPVDTGRLRAGWRRVLSGPRGGGASAGTIANSVPYVRVLEFGGYPVLAPGEFPPGPRTRRAPGGEPAMRSNVSKQAPRGMLRTVLQDLEPQFLFDVERALENLPSWRGR